jgi:hypothetical protein
MVCPACGTVVGLDDDQATLRISEAQLEGEGDVTRRFGALRTRSARLQQAARDLCAESQRLRSRRLR